MADRVSHRVLAVVLATASVGLAACGGPAHSPARTVPWVDRPLPPYSGLVAVTYPTTAPPCRAAQLRASQAARYGTTGFYLEGIIFTDVGARPCLLRGYPTISGVTHAGVRQVIHARHDGTIVGQNTPADMAHAGSVGIELDTPSFPTCRGAANVAYTHLVFTLQDGGRVAAPPGASIFAVCSNLSMTDFGITRCYCANPPPIPLDRLYPRISTPARVRAGAMLDYTVTLTNRSARTVSLKPCPGYTEHFVDTYENLAYSLRLNCSTVHAIPAHTSIRYQMRIKVPPDAAGTADVTCGIDAPIMHAPFVGGPMFTITGR